MSNTGSEIKPRQLRLPAAQKLSGYSRNKLYQLLAQGDIKAVKCGRATFILTESLEAQMASLPPAQFRPSKAA